jgi:hypothetical protein
MKFHDVWGVMGGWERLTLVGLVVSAVVQGGFVLIYSTRPWYRDIVGRAYMLKSATLLVLLWLALINAFFTYPLQTQVSTFGMWSVAAAISYQFFVLLWSPRRLTPGPERGSEDDDGPRGDVQRQPVR